MANHEENRAERWHVSQSIKLLRLYGAHRCLWNIHDIDYRNKKLRSAAWTDIAAAMGNNMTKPVALQKVNILRATYRYEKKRIKHRIRKGIGAKTKLKWFALADTFLRKLPKCNRNAKIKFSDDASTQIKDEINCENSNYKNEQRMKSMDCDLKKCETRKWTSVESMQFVTLLLDFQNLLKSDSNIESSESLKYIEKISDVMNISIKRIKARLQILKNTIQIEQKKMVGNVTYRPDYIWWPVIEKCLSNLNSDKSNSHIMPPQFVEVSKIPCSNKIICNDKGIEVPVTYTSVEKDEEPDIQKSINNFITLDQCNIEIDQVDDSNVLNNRNPAEEQNLFNCTEKNSTKLIYSGLQDDLLEGKWSLKHSVKFLRLYGAHPILWNLSHPDYRVRELRNAAMEDIAAAMGYGLTAQYVAKKIKIFRITYMQHRKRMLEDVKKGKGTDLQLRWFPLADSFLRTHIGLRSIKDQDVEAPQFDFDYVYTNLNLIDPELLSDINCNNI
ncbi:uncharacterized protein LOC119661897 isoform X2 [Teleopsis dalmanni]|uniref:uncharacterized protein LOC119661897 isoform X2 n=1 Tax=Teleopsis dalmanni TaxID=139649 RepID=UPI0018CDF5EB|nr:uncharacterized protein LOC119661897 isoform X2 [Teleopsis dalmanni]